MSSNVIIVTDATFADEVISSKKPILVDFWAQWCAPCLAIAPILEEIADEKSSTLTIAKIEVDQNPQITGNYHILQIPTLILFKDGKQIKTLRGAKKKSAILKEIESIL